MSALDGTVDERRRSIPGHPLAAHVVMSLSMLAFWAAIALPAFYLPLLAVGIDTVSGLALFVGLFGLHVLALVGGRSYGNRAEA